MKKSNRRFLRALIILLVIALAILAGYYFSMEKDITDPNVPFRKIPEDQFSDASVEIPKVTKEIPAPKDALQTLEQKETSSPVQEDPCQILENQVFDFFTYLNSKDYVQSLEANMDTFEWFKVFIRKVSSRPPVPAGEGLDKEVMIRNIFHFFRILNRKDIRLIKEILNNESDTLEMNLDLFYSWLMNKECPNNGIRPSSDIIYNYAGYFLNTLGGKSYLSRRQTKERLLIGYYAVITLYEMDKSGKNPYGIDIFPFVTTLLKDINLYPALQFKDYYIDKLTEIRNIYEQKR